MCGIAGVFERSGAPVSRDVLEAMEEAIAHRGPDGRGHHLGDGIGLVNRRLAIIDLSPAGAQPMSNERGDLVITYNGEVYNFVELRAELEGRGHRFRSHTDTEVVLHAYQEWGPAAVERFNGMFGLAIWNARERTLFIARDRFGVKPVYYAQIGSTFLFGSEIKAMFEHPAFEVRVSLPHVLEYFTFQNIFTDGTLFEGVKLLPAGHHLTLAAGATDVRPQRYWDYNFREEPTTASDTEFGEELDRLFRQAVQRQLVSDVPVGAHLSGGMDSGSITAVAAQSLPYIATFTVGFDMTSRMGIELGVDERPKAEAMSYLFKTEHYEAVLKAGDMERCLPDLVWHLEDLRVGQSYPNFYVSRLASKFVKVVLAGSGGDELFAGYPWRYYRAVVNEDFDHYIEKYYRFWHRLLPNRNMPELFTPDIWKEIGQLRTIDIFRESFPDIGPPQTPEDYVNHSLYLEAKTFLHGLLVVEDKLSMAHSLESRVPFLDNDLVDFAQTLPLRLKLRDLEHVVKLDENEPGPKTERYFQATRDGKLLLRRIMQKHVPASITDQVKQGFSGPDSSWFRGDSLNYIRDMLFDPQASIYQYFQPATVQGLISDHLEGRANRRLLLWSLISFEQWCRTFLNGRPR